MRLDEEARQDQKAPRGEVVRAQPRDVNRVLALLAEASLPLAGVPEHFDHFFVARVAGGVVGAIGMEPYGASALLRSLVVAPEYRSRGIGGALAERLITEARGRRVKRVFLLTETAPGFFASLGFQRIEREQADAAVQGSVEFKTVCCRSAVCMRLDL